MHIKIGRKVYNTEKSQEIARKIVSFFGDSNGYEEILYHKKEEEFFLFGQGGEHSQYAEARIIVLDAEETRSWLSSLLGEESATKLIEAVVKKTDKKKATKKTVKSKA